MNYIKASASLTGRDIRLFTTRDLLNLFPHEKAKTMRNNLTRWAHKGYFLSLKRDLYEFPGYGRSSKTPDLYVANRLYEPSYVSLETALSIYSIIPDIAAGVTSLTTRPTRLFKNRYGSFYYRTCTRRAFTGYMLMRYEGFKVNIADKEKALVDFFYYRLRRFGSLDFKEERISGKALK